MGRTTVQPELQISALVLTAASPWKFTNCTVEISFEYADVGATLGSGIMWALVYVPEGYQANLLLAEPGINQDIYNPTKNIMAWGNIANTGTKDIKRVRYGRKMMNGDQVVLLIKKANSSAGAGFGNYLVNYSVAYTEVH